MRRRRPSSAAFIREIHPHRAVDVILTSIVVKRRDLRTVLDHSRTGLVKVTSVSTPILAGSYCRSPGKWDLDRMAAPRAVKVSKTRVARGERTINSRDRTGDSSVTPCSTAPRVPSRK